MARACRARRVERRLGLHLNAFLSARYLIDRLRFPAERADELRALRQRLERQRRTGNGSEEQRALAERLRELREALSRALGNVRACSGCAAGHPEPFGHWPGGHCCGGRVDEIFSDDDLAALALAGTTPGRLTACGAELAGCTFRGPRGCSLSVRDRPNLCVRYLCRELETELAARGDAWREIASLRAELSRTYSRFISLRAEAE